MGPCWIVKCLGEKRTDPSLKPKKKKKKINPSLTSQKAPEDTATVTTLPITVRPFPKNGISGKKPLLNLTWDDRAGRELSNLMKIA